MSPDIHIPPGIPAALRCIDLRPVPVIPRRISINCDCPPGVAQRQTRRPAGLLDLFSRLFGCRVGVVDGIEKGYANAKAVAAVMAERDPEVRLH